LYRHSVSVLFTASASASAAAPASPQALPLKLQEDETLSNVHASQIDGHALHLLEQRDFAVRCAERLRQGRCPFVADGVFIQPVWNAK
jgi:hypothetical protein